MGFIKSRKTQKIILSLFLISLFQGAGFLFPSKLGSATLTAAKDTLDNSRLSFSTTLNGAHSVGATTIDITTSGQADTNTNHLFPGDAVTIGTGSYTVGTIVDSDTFTITSGLASGDNDNGDAIYVSQEAIHTITFTTASAVANGAIRILVPANTNDSNNSDSQPDRDGFDLDTVADSQVICPGDTTGFDFEDTNGEATDAATSGWHTFQCRYSGTGNTSTALTFTIGSGTTRLINAAPESGHSQGTADDYTITIRNLDNTYTTVDEVDAKVVLIEAVRVSATVESTLSFSIAGKPAASTDCGTGASHWVTSTVYSIPYGSISSFDSFYEAEQQLTVSTNAEDGYEVRFYEDDELGKDGADSPYIPDTTCGASACDHTTQQDWTDDANYNGFGYSLQNSSGTDAEFEWDDGTFHAKQLPNYTEGSTQHAAANAEIMSHSSPVSSSSVFVCYRLTVDGTQTAGDYYNTITYIATPQF